MLCSSFLVGKTPVFVAKIVSSIEFLHICNGLIPGSGLQRCRCIQSRSIFARSCIAATSRPVFVSVTVPSPLMTKLSNDPYGPPRTART